MAWTVVAAIVVSVASPVSFSILLKPSFRCRDECTTDGRSISSFPAGQTNVGSEHAGVNTCILSVKYGLDRSSINDKDTKDKVIVSSRLQSSRSSVRMMYCVESRRRKEHGAQYLQRVVVGIHSG